MKKIILLFLLFANLFFLANETLAYNVAQNISFSRGEVVIQAKPGISWSLTSKNATFTGTFMGPIGPLGTYPIYYCRNQYNTICVLVLNGTTATNQTVIDTIPINFDSYSGVWLKPTAKGLQPCNTPNIVLKNFKVEGTVDFGLPGDTVGVDIYTSFNIQNVLSNMFIQEQGGSIITNIASTPSILIWGNSFSKTFFVLTDTLQFGKNYSVKGMVNCCLLLPGVPVEPYVFQHTPIDVFRKTAGVIWNMQQCTPNDVISLDTAGVGAACIMPLPIDVVDSANLSHLTAIDTLKSLIVFPNPVESEIRFSVGAGEIELPKAFMLRLFDYQGRQILLEDKKSLPPYLSAGIYFLKISNGAGKSRYVKIIKE